MEIHSSHTYSPNTDSHCVGARRIDEEVLMKVNEGFALFVRGVDMEENNGCWSVEHGRGDRR